MVMSKNAYSVIDHLSHFIEENIIVENVDKYFVQSIIIYFYLSCSNNFLDG